jgi:hypothetical protein
VSAILCVQATVHPAVTDAFNRWYETEHIPDARRRLVGIERVTRWRSLTTDNQFTTVYEFDDEQQVVDALESAAIKDLIGEFDRRWSHYVVRERSGHLRVFTSDSP